MASKRSPDVSRATVGEAKRRRLTSEKNSEKDEGSSLATSEMKLLDLQALPEGCISHVISFTSPPDACRLAVLSRVIKSAAESDAVWDNFIPRDTHAFLSNSNSLPSSSSKKDLYMILCNNPILIEDDNLSFSLDKWSGKKCYMIAAKRLRIAWDNTVPYWRRKFLPSNQSRFKGASELYGTVAWFEIRGRIETRLLSPCTTYKAYLVYKIGIHEFPDSELTGFLASVLVTVGARPLGFDYECPGLREKTAHMKRNAFLSPRRDVEAYIKRRIRRGNYYQEIKEDKFPNEGRGDGWLEMELGEFYCGGDKDQELEMICCNIHSPGMQRALLVQGIEVRPES